MSSHRRIHYVGTKNITLCDRNTGHYRDTPLMTTAIPQKVNCAGCIKKMWEAGILMTTLEDNSDS